MDELGNTKIIDLRNTMYKKLKQMRPDSETMLSSVLTLTTTEVLKKTMMHRKRFYNNNMFDCFKNDMKKNCCIISNP